MGIEPTRQQGRNSHGHSGGPGEWLWNNLAGLRTQHMESIVDGSSLVDLYLVIFVPWAMPSINEWGGLSISTFPWHLLCFMFTFVHWEPTCSTWTAVNTSGVKNLEQHSILCLASLREWHLIFRPNLHSTSCVSMGLSMRHTHEPLWLVVSPWQFQGVPPFLDNPLWKLLSYSKYQTGWWVFPGTEPALKLEFVEQWTVRDERWVHPPWIYSFMFDPPDLGTISTLLNRRHEPLSRIELPLLIGIVRHYQPLLITIISLTITSQWPKLEP